MSRAPGPPSRGYFLRRWRCRDAGPVMAKIFATLLLATPFLCHPASALGACPAVVDFGALFSHQQLKRMADPRSRVTERYGLSYCVPQRARPLLTQTSFRFAGRFHPEHQRFTLSKHSFILLSFAEKVSQMSLPMWAGAVTQSEHQGPTFVKSGDALSLHCTRQANFSAVTLSHDARVRLKGWRRLCCVIVSHSHAGKRARTR